MTLQAASIINLTPRPARYAQYHQYHQRTECSGGQWKQSLSQNKEARQGGHGRPFWRDFRTSLKPPSASPTIAINMRIFLHPQLRAALPKSVHRDIRARVWTRFKSQAPRPSRRQETLSPAPKDLTAATTRTTSPAGAAAKTTFRRGTATRPSFILPY